MVWVGAGVSVTAWPSACSAGNRQRVAPFVRDSCGTDTGAEVESRCLLLTVSGDDAAPDVLGHLRDYGVSKGS